MRKIELTKGMFAMVDDEDFEKVNQFHWYFLNGYARRAIYINSKQKIVWLHRFIMNTPNGMETDHKNGNGLDNQKINLRICTHLQNGKNRKKQSYNLTGYKGVTKVIIGIYTYWVAIIIANGKKIRLGYFKNPTDAAKAYNNAAQKYHGDFSKINYV